MGSVVKTITKPFEAIFRPVGGVFRSLMPKMPDIPAPAPPPEAPPAEPAGPGASAAESSWAQDARNKILASIGQKKTKTLLTSAQGVLGDLGTARKKLLGE